MEQHQTQTAAMQMEIDALRRALEEVTSARNRLERTMSVIDPTAASDDNIYVFDEDDAEAQAFDAFYSAYDEGHGKRRRLLGRFRPSGRRS